MNLVQYFRKGCPMSGVKANLKSVVIVSIVIGFFLLIGCGGSVEKDQMAAFLLEYQKNLTAYEEAISGSDDAKKAEFKAKLEASEAQWTVLRDDSVENVTPQVIEKFDREYQAIRDKFKSLSSKS